MESNINLENNDQKKIKLDFKESKYATGRRKKSIARIWIKKGTGKIYVNGKNMADYFTRSNHQTIVSRPLEVVKKSTEFDVRCKVKGGGLSGQAGALRHGISKALSTYDSGHRPTLKKVGFLTRDSRVVERKKSGLAKARKSYQFSKR